MNARAQVLISGKVQGVFFRSFVRSRSRLWRLTGWVRNTKTGQVEALFEGEKGDIEKILDSCRQGPEGSLIEAVQVEWGDYSGNFPDFEIRYE